MDILIVIEHNSGTIHRMSWEAVAAGQSLAKDLELTTGVLVMGSGTDALSDEIAGKNVDEVITVDHPLLTDYSAEGYAHALSQVVESESPTYVIMGHTYMVRDFLPKVSVVLGKPLLGDNIAYHVKNDAPVFTKQVFHGKLHADVVAGGEGPYLVTFQSGTFHSDAVESGQGAPVRHLSVHLEESMIKTHSEAPFQEAAAEVDLSSAEVIVAVGRGIGTYDNVEMIKKLASVIGAQLAASRPVVDAAWLPSYHQVGSSGQTVAPKLYLALGISGAIQHVVGMKGSQNIVVINKDADAPLFEIADYGIVGDILEIVPKLTQAIQGLKTSGP